MEYSAIELFSYFFIYCFLGWFIESLIVSYERHKFINRGFLKLPLLPIYGSGALLLLIILMPYKNNIFIVYILGMITATILEYFVGAAMEFMFKMKYWDYSKDKFNYKGRICLESSLFWGVLSVVLVCFIHKYIEEFIGSLNIHYLKICIMILIIITSIDAAVSMHEAADIHKILEKISRLKNEIEKVYEEIDELLENAYNEFDRHKEKEELKIFIYKTKQNVIELKEKAQSLKEKRKSIIKDISTGKIRLLDSNPTAASTNFNEALKEVRSRVYANYETHKNNIAEKIGKLQKKIEVFIHHES